MCLCCSVESWVWKIIKRIQFGTFKKNKTNKQEGLDPQLEATVHVMINTLSSTPAGTTMGLKESECGQMGVIMIAGTLGWIMEAPAATAYAVLPVGVDTIKPGGVRETGREAVSAGRRFKGERINDQSDKVHFFSVTIKR